MAALEENGGDIFRHIFLKFIEWVNRANSVAKEIRNILFLQLVKLKLHGNMITLSEGLLSILLINIISNFII